MTHRAFSDFLCAFSCGFYVAEVAQVNATFSTAEICIVFSAGITLPKYAKITQLSPTNPNKEKKNLSTREKRVKGAGER